MDLSGRHVVITGASRGIGRAVAVELGRRGARLTLAARSADALDDVASAVGPAAHPVRADVKEAEDRVRLLKVAEEAHGPIDVLVNNAAVEWAAEYSCQPDEEIIDTVEVNLIGPMLLSRAVLPSMIERGSGQILNIASVAGLSGSPYESAYSASKAGLIGFTQALRAELRGSGVVASVVCPGFVAGDGMYARLADKGLSGPKITGVSSMGRVVDAVVGTVERGRALTIVNPTPLRPLLMMQLLLPGLHAPLMERLGVARLFRGAARLRADDLRGGRPADG